MALGDQTARYQTALQEAQARYQTMIADLTTAKEAAREEIAPEFREAADIYRTGGEYGAGAISRIQETAKQNLAASQAQLVSTGMSSGSLAAGVRARYSRDVTRGIQEVEDIRYERLGAALQAVGQAREARGARIAGVYSTSAQAISAFQQPTTAQYAAQEDITKSQLETETKLTQAQIKSAQDISKREQQTAYRLESAKAESAMNLQQARYSAEAAVREEERKYAAAKPVYGESGSGQFYF